MFIIYLFIRTHIFAYVFKNGKKAQRMPVRAENIHGDGTIKKYCDQDHLTADFECFFYVPPDPLKTTTSSSPTT
jgi:hypothetical protein